ncbi:methyltransferase [Nocardioides sp. B-3]|uniref:methyltransferase n=1 Tax=Nocardioides sp. B-3 TaxID=2895565 RepID=UPI00300E056B
MRDVVATDVNRRALWMTRFNAVLNGVEVDVREGSFFEPVEGERFDLIATNPPFVISPATGERLVYRDSGLPGDRVVEDIVRAAPDHLTEHGLCPVPANWSIVRGTDWDERLGSWLTDDCDALVIQREVIDPSEYVEMWLKDEGVHGTPHYPHRYDTRLSWFDEQGIEGVGFGWINVRAGGTGRHRLEEWRYDVEQPIGPAITDHFTAIDTLVDTDSHLVAGEDVMQETQGAPGAEDPATIVVRQQRGFRRARQVDTVEAALIGASDGDLTAGQILDAVADLTEGDAEQLRETYLPVVRELVDEGFLST